MFIQWVCPSIQHTSPRFPIQRFKCCTGAGGGGVEGVMLTDDADTRPRERSDFLGSMVKMKSPRLKMAAGAKPGNMFDNITKSRRSIGADVNK